MNFQVLWVPEAEFCPAGDLTHAAKVEKERDAHEFWFQQPPEQA